MIGLSLLPSWAQKGYGVLVEFGVPYAKPLSILVGTIIAGAVYAFSSELEPTLVYGSCVTIGVFSSIWLMNVWPTKSQQLKARNNIALIQKILNSLGNPQNSSSSSGEIAYFISILGLRLNNNFKILTPPYDPPEVTVSGEWRNFLRALQPFVSEGDVTSARMIGEYYSKTLEEKPKI